MQPSSIFRRYLRACASFRSPTDIPRVALFSERKFARTIGRWFGEIHIEDAPIPFFCVTSNLTDGVANMHRSGRFATWLRAASAIPGVFPPVIVDDIVHVDGGVLDNLPTGFMRELGASFVIAVDVGSTDGPWRFGRENSAKPSGQTRMPSMLELLWRVGTIGSGPVAGAARRDCNVVLRPDVAGVGMFGWHACEQAIEAGYRVALEHLREIEAAIGKAD